MTPLPQSSCATLLLLATAVCVAQSAATAVAPIESSCVGTEIDRRDDCFDQTTFDQIEKNMPAEIRRTIFCPKKEGCAKGLKDTHLSRWFALIQAVREAFPSAWVGHLPFAIWLTQVKPKTKVVVDLGVDYGTSTYNFAIPFYANNDKRPFKVYGVDSFEGESHAGIRDTLSQVCSFVDCLQRKVLKKKKEMPITIIKGFFEDIAAKHNATFHQKIDILHLDGWHTYEAVKSDFELWSPMLQRKGVVLFHDIESFDTTVGKFYKEIVKTKKWHHYEFTHSAGLGVLTRDRALIPLIKEWHDFMLATLPQLFEFNPKRPGNN